MSAPYWQHDRAALYGGDALAVLAGLPSAGVDAVITDPPYYRDRGNHQGVLEMTP